MTMLSSKLVKTRKPHQCHGCFREFPAKSMMVRWSSAYEGTVGSGHTCTTCNELMEHLEDDGDGYPEGFVAYITEVERGDITPEQLLEKVKSMPRKRRKVSLFDLEL